MDFQRDDRYLSRIMRPILSFFLLIIPCFNLFAVDAAPQKPLNAVQAISIYPEDIRQATIGTLSYPGTLVDLAQIQAKTRASFQSLLASTTPKTQKELWKLLRYPKLVEDLAAFGPQTAKSVKQIDAAYPKDLQAIAADLGQNHYDLLRSTSDMARQAGQSFSKVIQSLPVEAQKNFRALAGHSEIFHILNQSLQLSSVSPESFKKDPKPLTQKAQNLARQLQQAPTAAHPETWKGNSQDDPQAVAALQKAATQFEKQNDLELDENPHPKGAAQANVSYTPYSSVFTPIGWAYPFWFGWPDWDPYPFY